MSICKVFDAKATDFSTDGLGYVSPITCEVSESINGEFELELTHKYDSSGKWKRLKKFNIVVTNTYRKTVSNPEGLQAFRIHYADKNTDGTALVVKASHIYYDLGFNFVEDARPTNANVSDAGKAVLNACQYPTPFTFSSNILALNTAYYIRQSPVACMIGDADESIINRWGGELWRDNYAVAINDRLGSDKGVSIEYGKNLLGLEFEEDTSSVVTRIMPTGLTDDNVLVKLPEKYIDSSHINDYPFPIIQEMDSGCQIGQDADGANPYPNMDALVAGMRTFTAKQYESNIDIPTLSLSVNFVNWADTEQYKKYACLFNVNLGDTVTVKYTKYDVDVKLRVISVKYNCLLSKYEELGIGDKKISIVSTINASKAQAQTIQDQVVAVDKKVIDNVSTVGDILSDNKLTANEKHVALKEWSSFYAEKSTFDTQATTFEITKETSTYDTAFQQLSNYLNDGALWQSGTPSWLNSDNINVTTDIDGSVYRQKFDDYYSARDALVKAIYTKNKSIADSAVTGLDSLQIGGRNLILGTNQDTIVTSPNDNPDYPTCCFKKIYSGLINGKTYSFSAEITLSNSSKTKGSLRIFQENVNHEAFLILITADGTRQSCTFTVPNDGISYNAFVYAGIAGVDQNVTATYHHIKLEKGTKATDWSPAPEDIQNQFASVNSSINTITNDVNGLSTKVQTIDDTVNNTSTGLSVRMYTAESEIKQNSSSIEHKVEQSDMQAYTSANDAKVTDLSTKVTDLTQTVDDIQVNISSTGAKNLVNNSAALNGVNLWAIVGTVVQNTSTDITNSTSSGSAFSMSTNSSIAQDVSVMNAKFYSCSFRFKSSTAAGHVKVTIIQNSKETVVYENTSTGDSWMTVSFIFQALSGVCTLKIWTENTAFVSDIMFVLGRAIVDWSQSDHELYTENFTADQTGLTIGNSETEMRTHISHTAFEIYRGSDCRIDIAPDGTRLQKTIIEDDLTVGVVKEIVRGTEGVDFAVITQ